jgi:hypothetical protein
MGLTAAPLLAFDQAELWDGEDVAPCPSCTLRIRIIYDEVCTTLRVSVSF